MSTSLPPDSNNLDLLPIALGLAGLVKKLEDRTAKVQKKADEAVEAMNQVSTQVRESLSMESRRLREMYSPAEVTVAAESAKRAIADFHAQADTALAELKQHIDGTVKAAFMRIGSIAAGLVVGALAVVALAWHFVPTKDEIEERRAELAGARLIESKGQTWAVLLEPPRCKDQDQQQCFGRLK